MVRVRISEQNFMVHLRKKPAIYQPKINNARCFLPEIAILETFPHISPQMFEIP
jgi:hypothetical protein